MTKKPSPPAPTDLTPTTPYWTRLKSWRKHIGLTQNEVVRRTQKTGNVGGYEMAPRPPLAETPKKQKKARARNRHPSREALADLSQAVGIPPEEFPEYLLATLREALDEARYIRPLVNAKRYVTSEAEGDRVSAEWQKAYERGLSESVQCLTQLIEALDALATERMANGSEPPSLLRLLRPASGGGPPNGRAAG